MVLNVEHRTPNIELPILPALHSLKGEGGTHETFHFIPPSTLCLLATIMAQIFSYFLGARNTFLLILPTAVSGISSMISITLGTS